MWRPQTGYSPGLAANGAVVSQTTLDVQPIGRVQPAGQLLESEIVRTEEGLQELRARWDVLHAATGATNPFNTWIWVWQWWKHFARHHGLLRDHLRIIVMRDETATVRAIFPFVLSKLGVGRWSVRALKLYGFGGSLVEIRAPLVWPGWEGAAVGQLRHQLELARGLYHWCLLDGLDSGHILDHGLSRHPFCASKSELLIDYLIPLPSSWEELRGRLRRNIKESLRHCYNSLAREGHDWRFEPVSEPSLLPAALDQFFALHRARAEMPQVIPHANQFAGPQARAFLCTIAHELASRGECVVCQLRVNGRVVASRIVFQAGDTLYLYYSGYDPQWRKYSVMTLLTAECIRYAIDQGLRAVNLSPGTDISKTRWSPDAHAFAGVRLIPPTFSANMFAKTYSQLRAMRLGRMVRPIALPAHD